MAIKQHVAQVFN